MHAVDRDLQFLQSGFVQRLDHFRLHEKAVRDNARAEETKLPALADEPRKIGMQGRLAAGERDAKRAEFLELAEALFQDFNRHRLARLVVFGTVAAGQIAAADHDHLREQRAVAQTGKYVWRHRVEIFAAKVKQKKYSDKRLTNVSSWPTTPARWSGFAGFP